MGKKITVVNKLTISLLKISVPILESKIIVFNTFSLLHILFIIYQ